MRKAPRVLLRLVRLSRRLTQDAMGYVGRRRRQETALPLDMIRRRLELLLTGMYGRELQIETAEQPSPPGLLARIARRGPSHLRATNAVAASDGVHIRLPAQINAAESGAALTEYRLLALEQAERVTRGTAALAPDERDLLARDLYLLRESASVDRRLVTAMRSLRPSLAAARAEALTRRPKLEALNPIEREVELLVRQVLGAEPAADDVADTPAESLQWAQRTADRLRQVGSTYRGLPPVALWGTLVPGERAAPALGSSGSVEERTSGSGDRIGLPGRGSRAGGQRAGDERDSSGAGRGTGGENLVAAQQPGRAALPPPDDVRDAASLDAIDATVGIPDTTTRARLGVAQPSAGGDGVPVAASATAATGSLAAVPYPEWDYATQRYKPKSAIVHDVAPTGGSSEWADAALRQHAVLARRVRQRFERLRSVRSRLGRQREGEELDLAACVDALVDRRAGHAPDDRLYVAIRPARRAIAIALLVDVSGSTDAAVTDTQTVIDVEKTAVLLASEALDALGDRYTVLAFSGRGAANVRIATLKAFEERNGDVVRRRVSALAPEGNTRLGAAVRHASALLTRQPAGHRLLLLLSDGRPNDADGYQGRYAVEDSRQAIAEARSCGVYPFCLTVDREGPEYLTRIFGAAGHSILRHPEHLPLALVQVVRQLLAS